MLPFHHSSFKWTTPWPFSMLRLAWNFGSIILEFESVCVKRLLFTFAVGVWKTWAELWRRFVAFTVAKSTLTDKLLFSFLAFRTTYDTENITKRINSPQMNVLNSFSFNRIRRFHGRATCWSATLLPPFRPACMPNTIWIQSNIYDKIKARAVSAYGRPEGPPLLCLVGNNSRRIAT